MDRDPHDLGAFQLLSGDECVLILCALAAWSWLVL